MILATNLGYMAQGQTYPGSGNAYTGFQGNGNYIDLDTNLNNLTFPFSITAWVKLDTITSFFLPQQTILSSNNPSSGTQMTTGFFFQVGPSYRVTLGYWGTSSFGFPQQRQYAVAFPQHLLGQWVHLAGVYESATSLKIYVNGIDQTPLFNFGLINSMNVDPNNKAWIGNIRYPNFGGNDAALDGLIDEVAIWDEGLTQAKVKFFMCRNIPSVVPGLYAYYKFDSPPVSGVLQDSGPNNLDATVAGGQMSQVLSGAPVGDGSSFFYRGTVWNAQQTVVHGHNGDTVTVRNISGPAEGMHIYHVNQYPNSQQGLPGDSTCYPPPYFGTFPASIDPGQTSYRVYPSPLPKSRTAYRRDDNSDATWSPILGIGNLYFNANDRFEWIFYPTFTYTSNLPDTVSTCDLPVTLKAPNPVQYYYWNNSVQSDSIQAFSQGMYTFTVTDSCATTYVDTVYVVDRSSGWSGSVDLNSQVNQGGCGYPITLGTPITPPGVLKRWSNGSTGDSATFNSDGAAWVILYDQCDTLAGDTIALNLSQRNNRDTTINIDFCDGDSVLLIPAYSAPTYVWDDGTNVVQRYVRTGGTRTVIGINGCDTLRTTFQLTRFPRSTRSESFTLDLCIGFTLDLEATFTANSYLWSTGETSSIITVSSPGTYWVRSIRNCDTVENVFNVIADPVCFELKDDIFVPTAFTPNNDQINDLLIIQGRNVTAFEMKIYDRWGQVVFSSSSIDESWDGTINGEPAPVATYACRIRYRNARNKWKEDIFRVSLLR